MSLTKRYKEFEIYFNERTELWYCESTGLSNVSYKQLLLDLDKLSESVKKGFAERLAFYLGVGINSSMREVRVTSLTPDRTQAQVIFEDGSRTRVPVAALAEHNAANIAKFDEWETTDMAIKSMQKDNNEIVRSLDKFEVKIKC